MSKSNIEAETAKLAGLQIDFLQKLRNGSVALEEFEKFLNMTPRNRQKVFGTNPQEAVNNILRLLTINEKPVIKATSGKRYISEAKKVFKSYIDSDFKNWGLDKASKATIDTSVDVYELIADATFSEMFVPLSDDLDKLCLTQDQIIEFCLESSQWLRQDGYATLFLFKENEQFFVANVYVDSDGLFISVSRFEDDNVWDGRCPHRLVVSQL